MSDWHENLTDKEYRPKYPDSPFIHISDLVNKKTGKTYREENMELTHNIPIGALVEIKFSDWFGHGACWKVHARMWVVRHDRDCDGTPLYSISRWNDPHFAEQVNAIYSGFDEEMLKVVKITSKLESGENSLRWRNDD